MAAPLLTVVPGYGNFVQHRIAKSYHTLNYKVILAKRLRQYEEALAEMI
jgi:hypothetical protein